MTNLGTPDDPTLEDRAPEPIPITQSPDHSLTQFNQMRAIPGFQVHRRGSEILVLRASCAGQMPPETFWDLEEMIRRGGRPARGGRGGVVHVPCGDGGVPVVVKPYRHGGLLRLLTRSLYLRPTRVLEELELQEWLRSRKIPVAEPLALKIARAGGVFHRMYLVSREVDGARDLETVLAGEGGETNRLLRRSLVRRTGELVRRLHDLGVYHGDLNLSNILVDRRGETCLIDLDRSRRFEVLSLRRRTANLARLYRSLTRANGAGVRQTHLARFCRAYFGADWKEGLRRVRSRYRRSLFLHQIGWFLERLEGPRSGRSPGRAQP